MWRILVVDDGRTNRLLLEEVLYEKAVCDFASNGLEGYDLYKKSLEEENYYDLLLVDIAMPVMDGLNLLKKIREEEELLKIKKVLIIMLTAFKEYQHEAKRLGCDDYVVKPIDPSVLISKIEKGLLKTR